MKYSKTGRKWQRKDFLCREFKFACARAFILSMLTLPVAEAVHDPWFQCAKLLSFAAANPSSLFLQREYSWNVTSRPFSGRWSLKADALNVESVLPVHGGGVVFTMGDLNESPPTLHGPTSQSEDDIPSFYLETFAPFDEGFFRLSEPLNEIYGQSISPWSNSRAGEMTPFLNPLADGRNASLSRPLIPTTSKDKEGTRWMVHLKFSTANEMNLIVSSGQGGYEIPTSNLRPYFSLPGFEEERLVVSDFKILPQSTRLLIIAKLGEGELVQARLFDFDLKSRRVASSKTLLNPHSTLLATEEGLFATGLSDPSLPLVGSYFHVGFGGHAVEVPVKGPKADTFFLDERNQCIWTSSGNQLRATPLIDGGRKIDSLETIGLDWVTQISPSAEGADFVLLKGYKKYSQKSGMRRQSRERGSCDYLETRLVLLSLSGKSPVVQTLGTQVYNAPVLRTSAVRVNNSEWLVLAWRSFKPSRIDEIDWRLNLPNQTMQGMTQLTAWKATPAGIEPLNFGSNGPVWELPFYVDFGGAEARGRTLYFVGKEHIFRVGYSKDSGDDDGGDNDPFAAPDRTPPQNKLRNPSSKIISR